MQRYRGIDDQAISKHNQADIASSKCFTDEVGTPLVRDMPAAGYFTRENIRTFWECVILIPMQICRKVHDGLPFPMLCGCYPALNGTTNASCGNIDYQQEHDQHGCYTRC